MGSQEKRTVGVSGGQTERRLMDTVGSGSVLLRVTPMRPVREREPGARVMTKSEQRARDLGVPGASVERRSRIGLPWRVTPWRHGSAWVFEPRRHGEPSAAATIADPRHAREIALTTPTNEVAHTPCPLDRPRDQEPQYPELEACLFREGSGLASRSTDWGPHPIRPVARPEAQGRSLRGLPPRPERPRLAARRPKSASGT
jgi:hypothetical protein